MRKLAVLMLLGAFFLPGPAVAASQAECAIWLCLPGGFPNGCSAARDAMIDRITSFPPKSPLPPFSSCAVSGSAGSGGDGMSYDYGMVAYVPQRKVCTEFRYRGGEAGGQRCVGWEIVPEHYVKGQRCLRIGSPHTGNGRVRTYPEGCTMTLRFIDVFVDGKQAGNTYIWSLY